MVLIFFGDVIKIRFVKTELTMVLGKVGKI